jgi:hypothetical protein
MGTISAEHRLKPCYMTWVKARRYSYLTFPHLLCKQGVTGSIPVTSTIFLFYFHWVSCGETALESASLSLCPILRPPKQDRRPTEAPLTRSLE